jgi:hypothetical protein
MAVVRVLLGIREAEYEFAKLIGCHGNPRAVDANVFSLVSWFIPSCQPPASS